ncbi:uncharacterized protein LOC143696906 isoform X2 [Siphateles boraxobius]|uniref:uncharacterized protein LOC143696906 isoform X2 n=2 Tax=Siphateles boraxobius TaxID=180520 RepID=UPI0040639AC9
MKINSSNKMEECLRLVCETIGVHEEDEVGMDVICSLYKSVFLITANLEETKRAISQVRGESGGLSCSARRVLHVLLVMEKQRESREELYWELQMLKAGRIDRTLKQNTQSSTISCISKQLEQDPVQFSILCLQNRAKRLYTRLVLDGVWSVLPSLSQRNAGSMRPGRTSPSCTDILQLLYYKYDTIKEHLYREMLQDEYGVVWWDSMSAWDQTDCVCELEAFVEQAFRHRDLLQMCGLPGALLCFRSCGSVVLRGCPESVKPRDQAWSSKPREQAWSAVIFLLELESHYQEEKEAISALMNRVGQEDLRVIYLSMCVAVRRAEREEQSYTALLVARQHWDRWPYMRGSVSQELSRIWLQENVDPTAKKQQGWKKGNCAQQAVLQLLVLCQEQERKQLLEILHRVSLSDLQGLRNIQENNNVVHGNAVEQSCVLSLQQIKAALQEAHGSYSGPFAPGCSRIDVSWVECAIHLLTKLTQAHEDEAWTVLYSLPDLDPEGLWTLLHKYERELHGPSFHNLHEVLQSRVPAHASRGTNTVNTETERERTEQEHEELSDGEKQELCTGCGMVLDPEDTPYLEIVCVKDPRNEVSMMETRDGDRKREEGDIKSKGDHEEISVEKQNSLITLAWSKPTHGENHIQEVTLTQQKEEAISIRVQEDRANNTHVPDTNDPHDVNIYTHQENISAQYEETHSDSEKGETQTLIQQDRSGFITAGQQQEDIRDGDTHQPDTTPTQLLQNTDTPPASVHFPDAEPTQTLETHEMEVSLQEQRNQEICERAGEEQQLQREVTMRCLVDIQRKAERRWQRDRDRQLLRVQERLAIVQSRKADEDLLGLTQEDTLRHLTDTLRQEDELQQKTLVREKLQQMRRERSCILQTRRERNTAGFKELLAPTAQRMTETEEGH